ncbi:MAG: DUF58 domain-containing protein [Myxococcota bacterium]|nr:DUF58 domain-containing protein [Myxococcota bacterium]
MTLRSWRPAPLPPLDRFRLQPLILPARQDHIGAQRRGVSVLGDGELGDFAPYREGDDPRRLHLPSYLLRRRLITQLHESPARGELLLFLDRSATMAYGDPPRAHLCDQLTLALAAASLDASVTLRLWILHRGLWSMTPPIDSIARWWGLTERLSLCPDGPPLPLSAASSGALHALRTHALTYHQIVLSDGLWPAGLTSLLEQLEGPAPTTLVLTEDPADQDPPKEPSYQPGGRERNLHQLTQERAALDQYRTRLEAHLEAPIQWLHTRGGATLRVSLEAPLPPLFQRVQARLLGRG